MSHHVPQVPKVAGLDSFFRRGSRTGWWFQTISFRAADEQMEQMVSNIFHFHPDSWGRLIPIWLIDFKMFQIGWNHHLERYGFFWQVNFMVHAGGIPLKSHLLWTILGIYVVNAVRCMPRYQMLWSNTSWMKSLLYPYWIATRHWKSKLVSNFNTYLWMTPGILGAFVRCFGVWKILDI